MIQQLLARSPPLAARLLFSASNVGAATAAAGARPARAPACSTHLSPCREKHFIHARDTCHELSLGTTSIYNNCQRYIYIYTHTDSKVHHFVELHQTFRVEMLYQVKDMLIFQTVQDFLHSSPLQCITLDRHHAVRHHYLFCVANSWRSSQTRQDYIMQRARPWRGAVRVAVSLPALLLLHRTTSQKASAFPRIEKRTGY